MEVLINAAQIGVADVPGQPGAKVIRFAEPTGNVFTVTLDEKAAKAISTQLGTGLIVATGPIRPPNGNVHN